MKTFQLTLCSLTAMLLVGLTTVTFAQDDAEAKRAWEIFMRQSHAKQEWLSAWSGKTTNDSIYDLFYQVHFKESFGEQGQKIFDSMMDMDRNRHNDPDIKPFRDVMDKLRNAPFVEETQKRMLDLQQKLQDIHRKKKEDFINESLTPEQIEMVKEYQIVTMSGDPYSSQKIFSTFEVLGLSDEQRKQLEEIKKELRPEFEKLIDKEVERSVSNSLKFEAELEKSLADAGDNADQRKIIDEIEARMNKDPEHIRESIEYHELQTALTLKLKYRIFDVLTDEQYERVIQLVDNPPEDVKKILRKEKEVNEKNGAWQPGPNSWKPGDPIPEGYRQQRSKRRFPGTDNRSP